MNQDKKYNKELKIIVKNAGVGGVGIILEMIIRFVNNILITQHLGAGLYGLYVLANQILKLIINIGQLGITKTNLRFVSFYAVRNEHDKIKGTFLFFFKIILTTAVILLTAVFIFAPIIADVIYEKPEIKKIIRILIFTLPATLILSIVMSSLRGLKLIKQFVILKIAPAINFTIILLIVFALGYKLEGLVYGQLINVYIFLPLALLILFRKYFMSRRNIKPKVKKKELIKFSYPLYITSFISFFSKSFPIFFMGFMLANKEIGIYNVCLRLTLLTGFASSAFAIIFVPVISNLYGKGSKKIIEKLNKTITKWMFGFTLIMTFLIFLYAEQILSIFGKEFGKGRIVLYLIVTAQLLANATGLAGSILVMSGRPKIVLLNSVIMLILMVGLSVLFIPKYEILGAGIAYSASFIIINAIRLVELYILEKIHPYKISYYKPILAGLLSFFIILIFNYLTNINMYIEAIIGVILYILLFAMFIYLFKIDEDDRYIAKLITEKIKIKKFVNKFKK